MHHVGTVPTFKMHLIGTVPTFKMHHVGTVPTFEKLNVGTLKKIKINSSVWLSSNYIATFKVKVSQGNC